MSRGFFSINTYLILPHYGYAYYLKELKYLITINRLNEIPEEFLEMMRITLPFLRDVITLSSWYQNRSFENIEAKLFQCINHIRRIIVDCSCCDTFNKDQEELTIQFLRTLLFEIYSNQVLNESQLNRVDFYWNIDLRKSKDINNFLLEHHDLQSLYKFNNNLVENLLLNNTDLKFMNRSMLS